MHISKWGNSLAIRLPAPLAETLGLKQGGEVELTIAEPQIVALAPEPSREYWLARLREAGRNIPPDFKFDREEANAR